MADNCKSVQKCVRMTKEMFCFIDKQKGNGFNQKFENLVFRFQKEEKEKNKKIDNLDKMIKEQQKKLASLDDDIIKKQSFIYQILDTFKMNVESSILKMNNL